MSQKAIITGATSGIGHALTLKLASEGYLVGVTGRRVERLKELKAKSPDNIQIMEMDVTHVDEMLKKFDILVGELGGLDLCIANSGIGRQNPTIELEPELETIDVNVRGFVTTCHAAAKYFMRQGRGHLVGISSVAAHRGNAQAPAYNASKAFELIWLEGIHAELTRQGITVTDIRPGFVQTEMTEKNEQMFWVATPEGAAESIYRAIRKKKRYAYITPRWRYMSWLMRALPNPLWRRIMTRD